MKALSYLMITQMKNRLLSLKKKPAFLILYGFIILMVGFSVVMLLLSNKEVQNTQFADERILYLIIAAFGFLFLMLFTTTGLSTGSSLFTMPDVGLLFVSPISSKKILMYGLISTVGKSLLGSIFIFYQIGSLKANFGYGFKEIFALFIIFAIMVVFCQLLSIGIYIFTNGNPRRKNTVKIILYSTIAVVLLMVLLIQKQEQVGIMEAVFRVTDSSWFGYVPVAGWITMFFMGVVQGSLVSILIPLFLFIIVGILIITLLTVGSADYYEDVLLSTEITYQAQKVAKEGGNISRISNKKIKVKDDDKGIGNGSGAMVIFHKHILEMRRKSRFIFVDNYTLFLMVGLGIAAYNFKMKDAPKEAVYGVLGFLIYIQYFFTIMGRLKVELLKPYIYLIPEKSIKKVFAASVTSIIKPCVDGILMFTVFAIMGGADPLTCVFSTLAYGASGAVFTAMTILYQRVLGGQPSKMVQMLIGMLLLISIMTPAIIVSVVAAYFLPDSLLFLCTLPYTIFCLLFAAIMFITCGNLIDKAEYTGRL
ncbi:MAG: putative ABC exporter domain-containing protein [Mobilitalea sp.]